MEEFLCLLAWEWVNISLEYVTVAWMRLPRLFMAVMGVNLVTHPILVAILDIFGNGTAIVLSCEAGVLVAEWLMLTAAYGAGRWRKTLLMATLMNVVSFVTGILIQI